MADTTTTEQYFLETINTFTSLVEEIHPCFQGMSQQTATAAVHLARKAELANTEMKTLYLASMVHDLGMPLVPREIITAPTALAPEQLTLMQEHPLTGEKILAHFSPLIETLPIIRHHHENFDGSGYPDGLSGEEIPRCARILRIADAFVAMTSARPYRPAMSRDEALEQIKAGSGTAFDPEFCRIFMTLHHPEQTEAPDSAQFITQALLDIRNEFNAGKLDLPVLPAIVSRMEEVLAKPNSTAETLATVLEQDSSISLKLIATANSPIYRGTDKFQTVPQAVTRLGIRETRMIVNTIVAKGLYETSSDYFRDIMQQLWVHALATAACSRFIAEKLRLSETDRYFLFGLSHDVGKTLLIQTGSRIVDKAHREGTPLPKIPHEELLDTIQENHVRFGCALLQRWGFESDFIEVVMRHEDPTIAEGIPPEIPIVHLANRLTRVLGFSLHEGDMTACTELRSTLHLKLSAEDLENIAARTREYVAASSDAF